jgi:hypothetical protein
MSLIDDYLVQYLLASTSSQALLCIVFLSSTPLAYGLSQALFLISSSAISLHSPTNLQTQDPLRHLCKHSNKAPGATVHVIFCQSCHTLLQDKYRKFGYKLLISHEVLPIILSSSSSSVICLHAI